MAFRRSLPRIGLVLVPVLALAASPRAGAQAVPRTPGEVRASFLRMLDRPKVAPDPRDEAKPDEDVANGIVTEQLSFASDKKADGTFERVPVLIVRPSKPGPGEGRRPAVIALHGTGGAKENMKGWLRQLAARGVVGVAIDARYHGGRSGGARGASAYTAAITKAWRVPKGEPQEHPFYYDTVWDVWRTIDYLQSRPEVEPERIGLLGVSMGGIETWLACADERVAAAVPAIAVQSFDWGLNHDAWQGRANTIKAAHEAAAKDLGESEVNARVCKALWDKVIPGMLGPYDCPSMLRMFAPRPLLILNGELDPNCPLTGAKLAIASAEDAYKSAGAPDRLKVMVADGVAHAVTPEQNKAAVDWLVASLKPGQERAAGAVGAADVVPTRELADVNWMEFREVVPAKVDTVLLPTGTIEPHGVINNGADVTAPVALSRAIAKKVNAMVAPVIPYGMTGSMDAYPGAFSISEAAYKAYVKDVMLGLAKTGFKTIVVVNGHGGPQTAVLNEVAREVGQEKKVRTLVVNWWSYASDVTKSVFGEDGGHAGLNETAYVQAVDPSLVKRDRYSDDLAVPNPAPGTYSAYPSPASIGLYTKGQGYVKFDQKKADEYFAKVNDKVAGLILDMKRHWEKAGF